MAEHLSTDIAYYVFSVYCITENTHLPHFSPIHHTDSTTGSEFSKTQLHSYGVFHFSVEFSTIPGHFSP